MSKIETIKEVKPIRKPEWLKVKVSHSGTTMEVSRMLKKLNLNTVCDEAACPNRGECFTRKTATFMILGSVCSRNCTFCNVTQGEPEAVMLEEPENIAIAIKELGLKHTVITSVTRDDLEDGGAGHFVKVINAIRNKTPEVTIEVLIPDFAGNDESLRKVIAAKPDIINHNVETIPSLYDGVRPMAIYERSLELLRRVKEIDPEIATKSGLMLGLGEKTHEVELLMDDLRAVNCDILTIGQYLAPSKLHHPVIEYVTPEIFVELGLTAKQKGFKYVASSPLVRSSYHADEALSSLKQ